MTSPEQITAVLDEARWPGRPMTGVDYTECTVEGDTTEFVAAMRRIADVITGPLARYFARLSAAVTAVHKSLVDAGLIPPPPLEDPRARALQHQRNRNHGPPRPGLDGRIPRKQRT